MTSFQQAVCVGPVFSTPGRESTEKENGNGVLPVFQMKKNQQQDWGRSDSSHFEEGQVKKEIRNSVGNGARAPKHPCSVSGFSLHVLRYSHAPRCTTPPAARRERRGRGKNERENPSSRGGGECLAGPVAVPAHGGCEAKPPEADEEGKGASRKVSAFSFRRPHQCHTALLSE